jgi:hypothetical protein
LDERYTQGGWRFVRDSDNLFRSTRANATSKFKCHLETISLIRNKKLLLDMEFDTKIVVILRDDLAFGQKLNVTAFTISGISGTEQIVGENYVDASGNVRYKPVEFLSNKVLKDIPVHPSGALS